MALKIQLQKKFPGFSVDVAFESKPGESTVLFGPSGSGKSVILKMVAGLMEPDSGVVEINSRKIYDKASGISAGARERRTGYVPQGSSLFPHLTVAGNILYGLPRDSSIIDRAGREELVGKYLEMFNLQGLGDKFPASISGGQQQRVALARALVLEPELLLLDEPFSALDNPIRSKMRRCLSGVFRSLHIPLLLVTHDLMDCLLADTIHVMVEGRIVQSGTFRTIAANPASDTVRSLFDLRDFRRLADLA